MSVYDKYQITVNFIPGLPQNKFQTPSGKAIGVVMHSTAVYGDSVEGERNYEVNNWNSAFVHTFTSNTEILQVASFDFEAWHACQHGNMYFLGNELTQTHDKSVFLEAFDRWCWLAARQLFDLGIAPKDNETLLSHAQVTARWRESTHDDPCGMDGRSGYLGDFSYQWSNVVETVTNYYNQMVTEKGKGTVAPTPAPVQPVHIATQTLQKGSTGSDVVILQNDLNKLNAPCGKADGIYGNQTFAAVGAFQKVHGLVPDGICCPATWKALEIALEELNKPKAPVQPAPVKTEPVKVVQPSPAPIVPPVAPAQTPVNPEKQLEEAINAIPSEQKKNLFTAIVNFLKKIFGM